MKLKEYMSFEEASEKYHYDPETGIITHKKDWGNTKAGDRVGRLKKTGTNPGYRFLRINQNGKKPEIYEHRLAWLLMTGEWPEQGIDHKNGNKADNRWENLRLATQAQNNYNNKRQNKSGHRNITTKGNRFAVVIRVANGDYRKVFGTLEEAILHRDEMLEIIAGEYKSYSLYSEEPLEPEVPF